MSRAVFFVLALLAAAESSFAGGNYDLPRSKEGLTKCWNRVRERYGPNIQGVTQRTIGENTLVRYYVTMPGGEEWILTCHPASGKLVVAGHKP